jgi:polysaccharide deacetylase family protein (PEP-CTERM system associated)
MFRAMPVEQQSSRQVRLLSVDFEDWHQLVLRRLGAPNWELAGPALARQTDALLMLLDDLGIRATFFVLGMTARAHPELIEAVAQRGHEIGCHGDLHLLVHRQTRDDFAADLRSARGTIEDLTGRPPVGYRAPAFSITREAQWAYEVLAEEGFAYDASQHDSPRIRGRIAPVSVAPHPLALGGGRTLWEFPVAVWRTSRARVPVGGASYWSVLPTSLVLRGLRQAGPLAGLYLHPQELDPEPLRVALPPRAPRAQRAHATLRSAQRNVARRRAPVVLRAIGERFRLIPYGEAYAELSGSAAARS